MRRWQKMILEAIVVAGILVSGGPLAAGEEPASDIPAWTGEIQIATTVLTRLSAVGRVISVELFPRKIAMQSGDGLLWIHAVPGATLQVVFDVPPPAVQDCNGISQVQAPYVSTPLMAGESTLLCFVAAGTYPYRAIIVTPDSAIALDGVVVVAR